VRCVIQRVREARVTVAGRQVGSIGPGLLVLAGFIDEDTDADLDRMARKVARLRVFDDDQGVMNRSVVETGGGILAVSQFTLYADLRKGNRPSYHRASAAERASALYERFLAALAGELGKPVERGEFGAGMAVSLVNDGPVTLIASSREESL
jgi:D-tyrosyl-tRNA(Tyr) deacylase